MESCIKTIHNYEYDTSSRPLGAGSYGEVYKGCHSETKEEVALKIISKSKFTGTNGELILQSILNEIQTLTYLKDDNILSLCAFYQTKNNMYIITEYCNGGSLEDMIKKAERNNDPISEKTALNIVKQIAEAFIRVQKEGLTNPSGEKLELIHRDIKPANILFKENKVKLADFGFSSFIREQQNIECDIVYGTGNYMSPQILSLTDYSSKTDVWSTGIVLYEMLYGIAPWKGNRKQMLKDMNSKKLEFPKKRIIDKMVEDLIRKMLEIDEKNRITWEEIPKHPAFKISQRKIMIINQQNNNEN